MSRWFRFYDDAINDPKILRLAPDAFRSWVFLLCVASKSGGKLPPIEDVAFYLRTKPQRAAAILAQLVAAGLLDKTEGGFEPHNWSGRQYLSDTSKERVQRHRNKRAAAGLIPQWTAPAALRKAVYAADDHECVYCGSSEFLSIDHKTSELNGGTHDFDNLVTACRSCNGAKRDMSFDEYVTKAKIETLHGRYLKRPQTADNRTEQTTEQKVRTRAVAPSDDFPDDYGDQFWQAYPRKTDKLAAMKKLASLRKSGIVTFAEIMAGVHRYAALKTEPQYTKHPTTWLNAGSWADETQPGATNGHSHRGAQQHRSASADFFAGIASVAADIAGDGEASRPADEEIPRGRINING